jgi:hypothetical protein
LRVASRAGRLIRDAEGALTNLVNFLLFAALSLVLGLGSAHWAIDRGFALVAPHSGPWRTWVNAGSIAADPYTRAHVARLGDLPVNAASGLTYVANTDSAGEALSPACEYEIVARPSGAIWWSVALYDVEGRLISNKAGRHAFNSQNLTVLPDGTQRITMAPQARPGHWLPSAEDHDPVLVLRIIRPFSLEQQRQGGVILDTLPSIQKVSC